MSRVRPENTGHLTKREENSDMTDATKLDRLIDQEMAAFNPAEVQWETAVPETGDQIVFDTIGDVFIGLYLGSRVVPVTEKDGRETSFKVLLFTGIDGKPYQINSGWKLDSAFESAAVPERSIVRITYVKDVDTGRNDPMKDYRVEVAKRPEK